MAEGCLCPAGNTVAAPSVAHSCPMPLTLPQDELDAWIRLTLEPGIGPVHARHLLAAIGLPQIIFEQSVGQLLKWLPHDLAIQLARPASNDIVTQTAKTREWLDHPHHYLVTLADPAYPPGLLETHDPPPVLYVNGRPDLLSRSSIAIVGARHATPGGQENARDFARHLANTGWGVISGLAAGIDTAAHQGALAAGPKGGSTIAVLGTGIDIVYPARNRDLAHQIAAQGALVSEFPLGCKALPHQFPRRNRIVAGLSRGVLVVEAALQSGSLITARQASEIGREIFAIPGSIHSPLSRGCHALIRQGAKLVESGQDIIEELQSNLPGVVIPSGEQDAEAANIPDAGLNPRPGNNRGPTDDSVLKALGFDPLTVDTLLERTGLDIVQLSQRLTELELDGHIERLPDGRLQQQVQR